MNDVVTIRTVFANMRARALIDPMARAHQSIASHRSILTWRSVRWSLILTVNR